MSNSKKNNNKEIEFSIKKAAKDNLKDLYKEIREDVKKGDKFYIGGYSYINLNNNLLSKFLKIIFAKSYKGDYLNKKNNWSIIKITLFIIFILAFLDYQFDKIIN